MRPSPMASVLQSLQRKAFWASLTLSVFVSSIFAPTALAANRYWVGAKNGSETDRWESIKNWSANPRGASGASIPGSSDIAIFSFTGGTVRIRGTANVLGLTLANIWTGSLLLGTGTLRVGASGLNVGSGYLIGGYSGSGITVTATGSGYTQTGGVVSLAGPMNLSGSFKVQNQRSTATDKLSFTSTGTILFTGTPAGVGSNQTFTTGQGMPRSTSKFAAVTLNSHGAALTTNKVIVSGSTLSTSGTLTINTGTLDLTTNSVPLVIRNSVSIANSALASLTTASNVTVSGAVTISGSNPTFTVTAGTWTMNGSGSKTWDFAGKKLFNLTINNTGGPGGNTVTINNNLNLSGSLTITQGKLNLTTNSAPLVIRDSMTVANSAYASFITNSNVTVSGAVTVQGTNPTFTVTAGTWTMNGSGSKVWDFAGKKIFNLTINNTGGPAGNRVKVNNNLNLSGTLTITRGELDLMTNSVALVSRGFSLANSAYATFKTASNVTNSGAVTVAGSSATFTMTGSTWTQNGTTSQTIDFYGRKLNNFTLNNTGASGNNTETVNNPLNISGSLTITRGILNLSTNSAAMTIRNDMTVANSTLAGISTNSAVTISGALTVSGVSPVFTVNNGTWTMNGNKSQTWDLSRKHIYSLTINNTGTSTANTVTFGSNPLNLSGTLTVTQGKADLITNGALLTAGSGVTIADNALATLTAGDIKLGGDWTRAGKLGTYTNNNGTVTLNGPGTQTVTGSTFFYKLTATTASARTIKFAAGETQTITNGLVLTGVANNKLTLDSTSTTAWRIHASGTRDLSYLIVSRSNNLGVVLACNNNCTDNGSNTNWDFTDTTSTSSGGGTGGTSTGGGSGGGGGRSISKPTTVAPVVKPAVPAAPKAVITKTMTAKQRLEARKAARLDALKRVQARKEARQKKHK